ncbi:MAG: S-layer homology domain-containing protein [Bacillota bacterium]
MPADDYRIKRLLVYSDHDLTGAEVSFEVDINGQPQPTRTSGKIIWESRAKERVNVIVYAAEASIPLAFADLQDHWAAEEIQQLLDDGFISGYRDHTFRPENTITRAEFASVLSRVLSLGNGEAEYLDALDDKTDVPVWAYDSIASVLGTGLLHGYPGPGGKVAFLPAKTLTRVELATVLSRALAQTVGVHPVPETNFTDRSQIPGWALESVKIATESGLIKGFQDGTFRPQNQVTRAETAVMVQRLLQILEKEGVLP